MQSNNELRFKISSALKKIIGRELITDQYIAVFELVKNSFDAYSPKVEIIFKDLRGENPCLIIKDHGKGMNLDDLRDKWLFVAYSAKFEGIEDSSYDYREKIQGNRIFAGAKGIGRFSCDRLGSKLKLTTIKDEENPKIECLNINWDEYEQDSQKEFVDIDFKHVVLKDNIYELKHGTVLEISNLRDPWSRKELQKLKYSLEKLINPNQENDTKHFSIILNVEEELEVDKKEKLERNRVNGPVKNYLFETLGIKTTQIITKIKRNEALIETTLIDRGVQIYSLVEKNKYQNLANTNVDISFHLFYLNSSAKINFKKIMGIPPVEYGSVFMYKNGFRVYPFGDEGEDLLGIDRRKQQGYSRFLGTREIIGRIEIDGDSDELKETTSRDGGFIKTQEYDEMVECLFEKCLRRLERFSVDVIRWGEPTINKKTNEIIKPLVKPNTIGKDAESKSKMLEIVLSLTRAKGVIDISYDDKLLGIIEEAQKKSASKLVNNIERIAGDTNNPELLKQVRKVRTHLNKLKKAKEEAEEEADITREEKKEVESELEEKVSQNLFLKSLTSQDFDQAITYLHLIGVHSHTINNYILALSRKINNGKKVSPQDIKIFIQQLSLENEKIQTLASFATKNNIKSNEQILHEDLISFIEGYINNKVKAVETGIVNVNFINKTTGNFITRFKPIEIIIVFDNLISNSKKKQARAKNITIEVESKSTKEIIIKYTDDGNGLDKSIKDPNKIFDIGFTTTKGSGLGLYHIKEILHDMNGDIEVTTMDKKGIQFLIKVKK